MKKKIGFIGLGIMGKPMAKNLLKAGYGLTVYDIDKKRVDELADVGAKRASSSKDAAMNNEVIITMLPNSPQVKEVILGEDGVLEGAVPGSVIIDMSSIAPAVSKQIAAIAEDKGVEMIDAPVSGGEPKAVDGTLAIMAGGKEEVFEDIKDILLVMGSSAVLVGDIGSGNVTKLANQMIVAGNIAAMSEAMTLVTKAGVDPEKVYHAICKGLAGSTVLDAKMPKILSGDFEPGFRIELHIKDLLNAVETSHEIDSYAPLTAQILEIMYALKLDGKDKKDHSALINYYENISKIEVRKK